MIHFLKKKTLKDRIFFPLILVAHLFCQSVLPVCSASLFCQSVLSVCSASLFCQSVLSVCSASLFCQSVLPVCSASLFCQSVLPVCSQNLKDSYRPVWWTMRSGISCEMLNRKSQGFFFFKLPISIKVVLTLLFRALLKCGVHFCFHLLRSHHRH